MLANVTFIMLFGVIDAEGEGGKGKRKMITSLRFWTIATSCT